MEELQKRNKWFKVAILTSSINPQDKERSEAFDMVQGFLVKPIDLDKLAELKAVL
jgi:CheY-like chemotaxis protein